MNRCINSRYVNKNEKNEEVETQVTEFYKKWKIPFKALVSKERMGVENQRAKRYLTAVGKYDIFNLLCSCVNIVICAGIAQSVEQLIRNQQVVSSSLISSSSQKSYSFEYDFWLVWRGIRGRRPLPLNSGRKCRTVFPAW